MDWLEDIQLKIKRAREHLKVLDDLIETYFDNKPYRCFRESQPDSEELTRGIAITHEPSNQISLVAGDAIQNMRSTLDHIAYQLVAANGSKPSKRCGFPVFIDPGVYRAAVSHQKRAPIDLRGISDAAMAEIERLQPYVRGNEAADHPLWLLYELSNIDRHRRLQITTVHVEGHEQTALGRAGDHQPRVNPESNTPAISTFWFPRAIAQSELDTYLKGSLFVVFKEEGKLCGAPVQRLLKRIIEFLADSVIPRFESLFH